MLLLTSTSMPSPSRRARVSSAIVASPVDQIWTSSSLMPRCCHIGEALRGDPGSQRHPTFSLRSPDVTACPWRAGHIIWGEHLVERMKERVLCTGAAGFIGSHLCHRLVAEGLDVVG